MVNQKRVTELQKSLIQQRTELLTRVASSNHDFRDSPPHRPTSRSICSEGDGGAEEALYNTKQILIKKDLQMIQMIENALQNIKNANYGVCMICKRDIPIARLKVIPEAVRCVRCQTMVESNRLKF